MPREVKLTQYLRPHGTRTTVFATVDEPYCDWAGEMTLSCEVLTTGEVVMYARYADEPEELEASEVADNGPGERSPSAMLQKLIARVRERRHS